MKRIAIIFAVLLLVGGCDVESPFKDVDLILDLEDTEVDLGSGITVSVVPGQPSARTETISNDLDVKSVDEIRRIELKPSHFSFQSGTGKAGKSGSQATGTLDVYVFLGGIPLPTMPISVTIQNDVVTAVSPSSISFFGTTYDIDEDGVNDFLDLIPDNQRPDLSNWESMTMDDVRDAINQALSDASLSVSIGIEVSQSNPSDPLTGSLTLGQISVDAQVRK